MSEDDQDASRRYWKAAIAALPAEKRDAAWEFYVDKLAGTNVGDTLSGLILLLEANGIFLLTLPEKFHAELIQPINEHLGLLREELQASFEKQQTALRAADALNEEREKANKQFADTTALFDLKVRMAAAQIDTGKLANDVYCHLHDSIAIPLRNELRVLPEQSRQISEAAKAAESSIAKWHKIHFRGLLANCLVIAGVVALILSGVAYWQCKRHFDQCLAAEIARMDSNFGAINELLGFGIDIRVAAWTDADGKPVHDGYILTLSNAVDARMKKSNGKSEATLLVKQETLQEQMERTENDRQESVMKQFERSAHTLTHSH